MLRTALDYWQIGISVFPLRPSSKQPLVPWKEYVKRLATEQEIKEWYPPGTKNGIAGVMGQISGLMAIDCDDKPIARKLYRRLPRTTMMTVTPRGVHFLFPLKPGQIVRPRVGVTVLGYPADIRGEDSYVALGGSVHPSGKLYEKLGSWDPTDVPFFEESWIEAVPECGQRKTPSNRIEHISAYLQKVESIQGSHGSAGLVRAASVCRDSGLSVAETTVELLRWNHLPVVQPPWSDQELTRAITRVFRKQV